MNELAVIDHATALEREHRTWHEQFTYHLDLVPPILDAIVTMTIPAIHATQLDKPRLSRSKHVDNMGILDHLDNTDDGTIVTIGAATDAQALWDWLTAYTTAVDDWTHTADPAPALAAKVNPDPLTARAQALTTIGWLINHADEIQPIHELDQHRDEMFTLIRHLRGRYGVHPHPRRTRPRTCTTCGKRAVTTSWADNPNGSPKPIRIARCRNCGQEYTEETMTTNHENRSTT